MIQTADAITAGETIGSDSSHQLPITPSPQKNPASVTGTEPEDEQIRKTMEPADETEALVSVTEINLRLPRYHFICFLSDQTFKPADFS